MRELSKKEIMENKNSLAFFTNMAKNNPDKKSVKITKVSDFTEIDAAFILKYVNKDATMLDLASGSGLILNKIYDKVKRIIAVEAFEQFSKFIIKTDKITVVNQDISTFHTKDTFDLITMFGIVQYFNTDEIKIIYTKYSKNVKKKGKLIVKGQFGVKDDVLVSGYSDELETNYYSQYRYIDKEVNILKEVGFINIQLVDIYPPECNRWDNTHFYAITAIHS